MSNRRIVVHFSCGAASAVAAKLALAVYSPQQVAIVRAWIEEEHADNDRFSADCERWFNHPITILRDEKYGASVLEVWRRERYIKGPSGASCARALKRKLLASFSQPGDLHSVGFTAEEEDRLDEIRRNNPTMAWESLLIERGLKKSDCLAIVERAGIKLPAMYELGFNNNNCIGCCKGGKGYWNRVRQHFPERFIEIADIQDSIGEGAYFLKDDETGGRMRLRDLPLDAGKHKEPEISCSFMCVMAEQDIAGEA